MGQLGEPGPRYRALWAMWADAVLLEAEGKAANAFAVLAECWDRCEQLGLTLDFRAFGPDLVRLALASGERNGLGTWPSPWLRSRSNRTSPR